MIQHENGLRKHAGSATILSQPVPEPWETLTQLVRGEEHRPSA